MTKKEAVMRVKSGNFSNGFGFDMRLLIDAAGTLGEMFRSGQINEVVRCKNCKHQDPEQLNNGSYLFVCKKGHIVYRKNHDWFCADGERKDDDA